MRALMLRAPESLLADRRRIGADRWDEVWEGVLHLVPPPTFWHQKFGTKLSWFLLPLAEARGLEAAHEAGVYRPGTGLTDYRVPDLVHCKPEHRSERGVEGRAELVIEILSDDDESREKLPFYASLGIPEVWLIDPETRAFEVLLLRGSTYELCASGDGPVRSTVLDVALALVAGPRLRLTWSEAAGEI